MERSMQKLWLLIAASVVILGGMGLAGQISAQPAGQQTVSGNGFRVSPVTSDYTIEPGKTEVLTITLENPTDSPTTAVPIVNDFVPGDNEDGEVRPLLDLDAEPPRNSFRTLVEELPEIELGPREKREINVAISVPSDANAGGYYGVVRFEPKGLNDRGNVTLAASVGSIALVQVPGDLTERIDLEQLSAAQGDSLRSFLTGGDVSVLVRLKNSGDIHVQPFGKVQIKNMFGDVVETYELNDNNPRAYVLPDTIRRFQDDLEKENWFGRYTIEANIGHSQDSGDVLSAQSAFWYVPAWALVVMFAALAAIAFGVVTFVNRRSGKQKRTKR